MDKLSVRLREERERISLNQEEFGKLGGVKKLSQSNYERGERIPDAAYLHRLSSHGVDVEYILTGVRRTEGYTNRCQPTLVKELSARLNIQSNISPKYIAEKLGVPYDDFEKMMSGELPATLSVLAGFVTEFGIDAQWLLTGRDSKDYKYESKEKIILKDKEDKEQIAVVITTEAANDYEYVPVYDVEVSAGNGAAAYGVTDPSTHLAFRKEWIHARGLNAKNLNCVVARGDSMQPTIDNKDTLLVDTSRTNPRDGHIYVIRSGDMLWVKRIQLQLDGSLLLLSDNQNYPPMPLTLADHPDMQVIGQVVQVSKDLI